MIATGNRPKALICSSDFQVRSVLLADLGVLREERPLSGPYAIAENGQNEGAKPTPVPG